MKDFLQTMIGVAICIAPSFWMIYMNFKIEDDGCKLLAELRRNSKYWKINNIVCFVEVVKTTLKSASWSHTGLNLKIKTSSYFN